MILLSSDFTVLFHFLYANYLLRVCICLNVFSALEYEYSFSTCKKTFLSLLL